MVKVGVIGPGSVWETRYRPALEKLGGRIGVVAVYDFVAQRAEQVAAEMGAFPSPGILAMASQSAVQAILLLDTGWAGRHVIELLSRCSRPVYVAGSLGSNPDDLHRVQEHAAATGMMLMPEFTLRHTPATARLQELLATKLGRPQSIIVEAIAPAEGQENADPGGTLTSGTDFLVGLLDWCRYVVRATPVRVTPASAPVTEAGSRRATIEFATPRKGGAMPQVEIVLRGAAPTGESPSAPPVPPHFEISCERGRAAIAKASEIVWSNGSADGTTEALTSDRSSVEVMLDHFCRRVVGGLIPVADLGDVCRAASLAKAVEQCLDSGQPVEIQERP